MKLFKRKFNREISLLVDRLAEIDIKLEGIVYIEKLKYSLIQDQISFIHKLMEGAK